MTGFLRNLAIALGWTTLALTGLIEPMVGRGKHLALYHWDGTPLALFGPVLLLFTLVWAGVALLLLSAQRPGRWRVAVWSALVLLLPWLLANAVEQFITPVPFLRVAAVAVGLAGVVCLVVAWRPSFTQRFEHEVDRASTLLLVLAFSGGLCLVQLLWFWWSARNLNAPYPDKPVRALAASASRAKVIWIVFDELSYEQVFEHRFAGLQLPAFDALASQSVVWTHVVPAGTTTDLVLPSLIMGKPVAAIRASGTGQLFTRASKASPWAGFDEQDTVFQDARTAGYSTGIAGWYNPYCRIMPTVLDHCFWRMYTELDNGLGSDESFQANVRNAIAAMRAGGLHDPAMTGTDFMPEEHNQGGKGHLDDYQQILLKAQRLLANPSANFLLIHLPVPHPGGLFNRRTGQFALEHTSYIDNLALADQCLATLRTQLQAAGEWDRATVVVMGDHSWRTNFMWQRMPAQWTPEDERASNGGRFDDRPAYLVKLPGQTSQSRIALPFQALHTRPLLDDLLDGTINTPDQLLTFVKSADSLR